MSTVPTISTVHLIQIEGTSQWFVFPSREQAQSFYNTIHGLELGYSLAHQIDKAQQMGGQHQPLEAH